ncbi:hypothetical protein P7C70_g5832, partial [Phenoliferia sp. Uapishka_3]
MLLLAGLALILPALAHEGHSEDANLWKIKYGPSIDLSFSGIVTFAHLPHHVCLTDPKPFDVAVLGAPFDDYQDLSYDASLGFMLLTTDDIDDMRPSGIIKAIRDRVGDNPCYLSFDIDTIDPSMAPASKRRRPRKSRLAMLTFSLSKAGTPESGGWTTREVKKILRGLSGLNMVGLDVVEVSPAYDTNAELTGMAAADLVQEFLSLLIKDGSAEPAIKGGVLQGDKGWNTEGRNGHDEL